MRAKSVQRARRTAPIAAAASLLIAAIVALRFVTAADSTDFIAGDVNGDRRVDVIDAYRLARAIEAGREGGIDRRFDFSHDSLIDHGDVSALMEKIVSLDRGRAGG